MSVRTFLRLRYCIFLMFLLDAFFQLVKSLSTHSKTVEEMQSSSLKTAQKHSIIIIIDCYTCLLQNYNSIVPRCIVLMVSNTAISSNRFVVIIRNTNKHRGSGLCINIVKLTSTNVYICTFHYKLGSPCATTNQVVKVNMQFYKFTCGSVLVSLITDAYGTNYN